MTDATGAVLPNTSVEASGPTGLRATESDDLGFYRLAHLLPGTYTVLFREMDFRPSYSRGSNCRLTEPSRSTSG